MALPPTTIKGDLPEGLHQASLEEVLERFDIGSAQRRTVTQRMLHIHQLASSTGHLQHFILFGSYITTKEEPGDVDIILVMDDDFDVQQCTPVQMVVFNHLETEIRLGASVFWIRPALMFEPLESFIESWQTKRDGTRRGIVEVLNDKQ